MKNHARTVLAMLCTSLSLPATAALTMANYQALVEGQNPSYYFTFNGGSLTSSVGSPSVTFGTGGSVASQAGYDVFQGYGDSFFFTLQGDVLYDVNLASDHLINGGGAIGTNTSTSTGTITLLFRTVDPGPPSGSTTSPGSKYVFTAGDSADPTNANALFLRFENPNSTNLPPNSLTLGFGDSTTTLLAAANVVPDAWYYFALTYNESALNPDGSPNVNKAAWYLGRLDGPGALLSGTTSNITNALAGGGSALYIGSDSNNKSTFDKPGDGRVDDFATWARQLSAAEVEAQFAALPNVALPAVSAYQTVISNQAPAHYFKLAGNTVDSMNAALVLSTNFTPPGLTSNTPSVGPCYDYFGDKNGAYYFAFGNDSIYANANLLNGGGTYTGAAGRGVGSISGMFHGFPSTNYYSGQKLIFDAGGSLGTSNSFALLLETTNANDPSYNQWALKVHFGDSTSVLLPATNMQSEWYYFAISYNEAATNQQVQWWAGRPGTALQSGYFTATNGSLAGGGNAFYLGNSVTNGNGFRYQNSSHTGNGQVSQVAIWNRELTTNEVAAQFDALTVRPALSITPSGGQVLLSWPLSADPSFGLQSTPSLSAATWSSAGAPGIVGNQYVVTNSMGPNAQFYRLTK
jgi:hypothetical protein